eukprot:scaffold1650_cov163-Amphora_coffeaeformis.AAC.7
MVWKSRLLQYGSMLSLAAQSARLEQAMNVKLVEMATAAQRAASLQISAASRQAKAAEAEGQATAERAQAGALQQEAAAWWETSNADAARAAAAQAKVQALRVRGAAAKEQAAAHGAAAAFDEATAEAEMAQATADVTEAATVEAQARGEELGMIICEFVPFLDVACNVVGGITAVGMEGLVATEAVQVSAELTAATAAQVKEEKDAAVAAEWQARAAQDGVAAAEWQAEEAAEAELAQEERVVGGERQAEADTLLEHALVEQDAAAEEEALAAEQQEEAVSLMAESIGKGVLSCWDAIMASLFGMVACVFFLFQLMSKTVPTAVAWLYVGTPPARATVTTPSSGSSLWRDISYNIQHCAIFILVAGIFSNLFTVMDQTSLQARGGIILGFAFAGACTQTIFLHMIPGRLARSQTLGGLFLHGTRFFLSLSVLYTLELLILWAALGQRIFTTEWLERLDPRMWWAILLIPLGAHLRYLEIPLLKRRKDTDIVVSIRNSKVGKPHATEADAFLPIKHVESNNDSNRPAGSETKCWFALLREDLAKLQLPFEILITACMLDLLIHCIAEAGTLWPASNALLLSKRPDWLVPLIYAIVILAVGGILVLICSRRSHNSTTPRS